MAAEIIQQIEGLLKELAEDREFRAMTPEQRSQVRSQLTKQISEKSFRPVIRGQGSISALSITEEGIVAHYGGTSTLVASNLAFLECVRGMSSPANPHRIQHQYAWLERIEPNLGRVIISSEMHADMTPYLAGYGTFFIEFLLEDAYKALKKGLPEVLTTNFVVQELPERSYVVYFNSRGPSSVRKLKDGESLWTSLVAEFGEELCDRVTVYQQGGYVENPTGQSRRHRNY